MGMYIGFPKNKNLKLLPRISIFLLRNNHFFNDLVVFVKNDEFIPYFAQNNFTWLVLYIFPKHQPDERVFSSFPKEL